jgi:hypothetical protein
MQLAATFAALPPKLCAACMMCDPWHFGHGLTRLMCACIVLQLLLDAGSGEDTGAPVSHVRQRKSILLRMPLGAELFLGE